MYTLIQLNYSIPCSWKPRWTNDLELMYANSPNIDIDIRHNLRNLSLVSRNDNAGLSFFFHALFCGSCIHINAITLKISIIGPNPNQHAMQTPDLDRNLNGMHYCVPKMPVADIEFSHVMQNLDHEILFLIAWIFSCVVHKPRLLNPFHAGFRVIRKLRGTRPWIEK